MFSQFARNSFQLVRSGVRSLLTIPKTQKAVVFDTHGGPLVYKDVPVPVPKSHQILINVQYTGVCQSDLHAWEGDWPLPTKLPLIGGHEGAGVVVAKGDDVTNFEIGDYAGIKWLHSTCLSCEFCEDGNEAICPHQEVSGYTVDGSFQQYAIADVSQAAKIPKGTDLAGVAPVMCAGVTVYRGIKKAALKPGSWMAITGAGGGLGSLAIQYATNLGLRVIAIDGGEEKGEFVKSLGAEEYVDFTKTKDIVGEIISKTGGGAHGVLVVASSEALVSQAIEYVRPAGNIILIGVPRGDGLAKSPIFNQVTKYISIIGSSVGNRADTKEAIDFFSRGKVRTSIQILGLSQLPEAFDLLKSGKVKGRIVLDNSK